jgi:hypothetical protein
MIGLDFVGMNNPDTISQTPLVETDSALPAKTDEQAVQIAALYAYRVSETAPSMNKLQKSQSDASASLITKVSKSNSKRQTRSIIRIPPKEEVKTYVNYKELPCTAYHKEIIGYIITVMGTQSYFWLFRHSNELKAKGKEINDLHPLKFLETIFSPEGVEKGLRGHMDVIMDSRFTRNNFLEGVGTSLSRKAMEGELQFYISDFAQAVKVPSEEIQPFFQNHDWESMVKRLMELIQV